MATVEEILAQLSKVPVSTAPYGQEANQNNAFAQATELVKGIVNFQKSQKAAPFVSELQNLSGQYAQAAQPQQIDLNSRANALRHQYIASGGSPMDLPKELWGSDVSKGFQIGQGQFTQGIPGDNLSIGQKQRQSAITGMYENQKTWDRQREESGLDIQKLIANANINNTKADNAFNQEKFNYDKIMDVLKLNIDKQNNSSKQLQDIKDNADKYFEGIKVGQYSNDPMTAASQREGTEKLDQVDLSPVLKGELKANFSTELDNFMTNNNPVEFLNSEKAKKYLVDKYGSFKANHLYNSLQSALGNISVGK